MRRATDAMAVVTLVCALSGCGVASQSRPQVIDHGDVPFGLANATPGSPTREEPSGPYSYELYFVAGDRLQPVTRGSRVVPKPAATLRSLVRGPDATGTEADLRTVLPPDVTVDAVHVDEGVATVELSGDGAAHTVTDEQALGIAQLVYTVTALPHVDRVSFEIDGRRTEVPRGDGILSTRPVGRSDYPNAAP